MPRGTSWTWVNGIKIAIGAGDLADGNTFEVDAFADADTSGVLAATGMNVFLTGKEAADMAVHDDIVDDPGRIATALGADMTDNTNALRMTDLRNRQIASLESMTPAEFYRRLTADIGQQVAVKQYTRIISRQWFRVSGINRTKSAASISTMRPPSCWSSSRCSRAWPSTSAQSRRPFRL